MPLWYQVKFTGRTSDVTTTDKMVLNPSSTYLLPLGWDVIKGGRLMYLDDLCVRLGWIRSRSLVLATSAHIFEKTPLKRRIWCGCRHANIRCGHTSIFQPQPKTLGQKYKPQQVVVSCEFCPPNLPATIAADYFCCIKSAVTTNTEKVGSTVECAECADRQRTAVHPSRRLCPLFIVHYPVKQSQLTPLNTVHSHKRWR